MLKLSKALIAAGCFWGIEEYFRKINGIINTKVGYSGGHSINPSYEEVCTGITGHAETVFIEFNEEKLSYKDLMYHFFKCHDPTQLDRQGPDIGTQYRSAIFYYNNHQKKIAETFKEDLQKKNNKNIVTEIVKANKFYLAETYHQEYLKKRI
tara:strand:+ start:1083 stop:1538 length:456 start_codon:yes stop_codon:yes gene_type:complete